MPPTSTPMKALLSAFLPLASLQVAVVTALPASPAPSPQPSVCTYTCPTADTGGFQAGGQADPRSGANPDRELFCDYPTTANGNPLDFYCVYSKTTGSLTTDNDSGFCPDTAAASAGCTRSARPILEGTKRGLPKRQVTKPSPADCRDSVMKTRSALGKEKKRAVTA